MKYHHVRMIIDVVCVVIALSSWFPMRFKSHETTTINIQERNEWTEHCALKELSRIGEGYTTAYKDCYKLYNDTH